MLPGALELGREGELHLTGFEALDGQVTRVPEGEQVKAAPLAQVFDEDFEDGFPGAGMLPAVEALIADLPGRGHRGDIVPGRAGGELPEDVLDDEAVIEGGAAAGGWREEGLEEQPLGVGDERSSGHWVLSFSNRDF